MKYPSTAADCGVFLVLFSLRTGGTGGEFHDGKRFASNSVGGEAKDRATYEIEASVLIHQPRYLGCYTSFSEARNGIGAYPPCRSRSGLHDGLGTFLCALCEGLASLR